MHELEESTFEAVKEYVSANGGVATVLLWRLRDAAGIGRLTAKGNVAILKQLKSYGLLTVPNVPDFIPTDQWATVRVYEAESAIGRIITAAATVGEDEDEYLRDAVDGRASDLLERVRLLICE